MQLREWLVGYVGDEVVGLVTEAAVAALAPTPFSRERGAGLVVSLIDIARRNGIEYASMGLFMAGAMQALVRVATVGMPDELAETLAKLHE